MTRKPWHYDRHVSVDNSQFDCALELTLRDPETHEADRVVRIPVEDIPDFLAAVARHSGYALTTAARRLEVGDCNTCGNTGLVDAPAPGGRMSNKHCPDCRGEGWPTPFVNTPQIHAPRDTP